MKFLKLAVLSFFVIPSLSSYAASDLTSQPVYSSSRADENTPDQKTVAVSTKLAFAGQNLGISSVRPFSAVGVAVKVGSGGVGFDVAVPVASRLNVRAGASFFSYTTHVTEDGIPIDGTLNLRSGNASLDIFPFGNGFRISPGVLFYNGDKMNAIANVPGGQSFELNDVSYTSSPSDPVNGNFDIVLGRKAAPSLTLGWGNMVPRSGKHFSFPVEVGVAFVGDPTVTLNLHGTACNTDGCGSIQTDPDTQANLQAEQKMLKDDIAPLRFLPIVSVGVSFKF